MASRVFGVLAYVIAGLFALGTIRALAMGDVGEAILQGFIGVFLFTLGQGAFEREKEDSERADVDEKDPNDREA